MGPAYKWDVWLVDWKFCSYKLTRDDVEVIITRCRLYLSPWPSYRVSWRGQRNTCLKIGLKTFHMSTLICKFEDRFENISTLICKWQVMGPESSLRMSVCQSRMLSWLYWCDLHIGWMLDPLPWSKLVYILLIYSWYRLSKCIVFFLVSPRLQGQQVLIRRLVEMSRASQGWIVIYSLW